MIIHSVLVDSFLEKDNLSVFHFLLLQLTIEAMGI
jgi:hypothetical protein